MRTIGFMGSMTMVEITTLILKMRWAVRLGLIIWFKELPISLSTINHGKLVFALKLAPPGRLQALFKAHGMIPIMDMLRVGMLTVMALRYGEGYWSVDRKETSVEVV